LNFDDHLDNLNYLFTYYFYVDWIGRIGCWFLIPQKEGGKKKRPSRLQIEIQLQPKTTITIEI
jgi:hypothetical protein